MASFTAQLKWSSAFLLLAGTLGCASPGLPKQPSLGLPALATDLSAIRERDTVMVRFTKPTLTVDKLALKGPITAELCRQESTGPCNRVSRQTFAAPARKGETGTLTDVLPPALTSGSPALLTYRVTLFSDKNRALGPSTPAYSASGAAPDAPLDFEVSASQGGAVLHWRAGQGSDTVELERKDLTSPQPHPARSEAAAKNDAAPGKPNPFQEPTEPSDVRLRAGDTDVGGTVDAGAQFGQRYSYIAWRVRRLTLVGHVMDIRSAPTAAAAVAMRDSFPPAVPGGLTAVPATSGVDLSWEPDADTDLAGYFIYRTSQGATPARLNDKSVEAPAFHDATAAHGVRYHYSVSAVDHSGNESRHSSDVEEGIE